MPESFVQSYITNISKNDGVALDVGSNHGKYLPALSAKFKTVYAFEPDPDNQTEIEKLLSSGEYPNVILEKRAIGTADNEQIKLYQSANRGGHSISTKVGLTRKWGHKGGTEYVKVDSITLNTFCKDKDVRFIKCDIEGAEDIIFEKGAENFLINNNTIILLETHDTVDYPRLSEFFKRCGYKMYDHHNKEVKIMSMNTHYVLQK